MKRGELLARIKAHLIVKTDATCVQSIVKGVLKEDKDSRRDAFQITGITLVACHEQRAPADQGYDLSLCSVKPVSHPGRTLS